MLTDLTNIQNRHSKALTESNFSLKCRGKLSQPQEENLKKTQNFPSTTSVLKIPGGIFQVRQLAHLIHLKKKAYFSQL